ncbi:aminotransferase class I/II-fold pyridoxal phosphate-dependent enzyme [Thalassotalea fusca]
MMDLASKSLGSLCDVDETAWRVSGNSSGLRKDFLSIVEESKINDLTYDYLLVEDNGKYVGKANLYLVDFDFSTTDQSLGNARGPIKYWYPEMLNFKVFEMGLFTMIGDGYEACSPDYQIPVLDHVTDHMIERMAEMDSDYLLIRDIPLNQYEEVAKVLQPKGFLPCSGFTNAVLYNHWQSFEEYVLSHPSKGRGKIRSALKYEEKFGLIVNITNHYAHLAGDMQRLWQNVNQNSKDYSREQLTESFFAATQKHLPENSEVITIEDNGKLIAFMYNLIGDDDYIMLDWGVDYSYEHYKQANLYRIASLISVRRMIELGKGRLELGITNYVPKTFLGATLEPLLFFVRHRHDHEMTEALARCLTDNISHADGLTVPAPYQTEDKPTWDEADWREFVHQKIDGTSQTDIFAPAIREYQHLMLKMAGLYGFYPEFRSGQYSSINYENDQEVVLLGTNSYLGLNTSPALIQQAIAATDKYGTGCSGSPLLNGTLDIHNQLSAELALFTGKEAAVLCSTGYQTNLAAISALASEDCLLLMDERNHRSLFDAATLSKAKVRVFAHRNMEQLERLLQRSQGRKTLIVSDSVFSMEGTIADIRSLVALKKQYNARLFIDESHGLGVLGRTGAGACEQFGVMQDVDVIMGTFSKSLAAIGGFVSGDKKIIDYIKHHGAGHIFSASLPASVTASVLQALQIIRTQPALRQQLSDNTDYLVSELNNIGFAVKKPVVPIVHLILGHSTLAFAAYKRMLELGVYVNPVLPPAVPEEESGFRISLMANHRKADLEKALFAFNQLYVDLHEHGYALKNIE